MSLNYIAYLTANDDHTYTKDMLNFRNMARLNPGVEHINLYVAVSAVTPFTDTDTRRIKHLVQILEQCTWITVVKVLLKSNTGRDFSSAYVCLKEIAKCAADNDVVMVKNRSGYGPLAENWFASYAKQLRSNKTIGLVGSTINFNGHPKAEASTGCNTHVQTYVYMSYWRHFARILDIFPAIHCTDRLHLITDGEIGLSRMFMEKGFALSCVAWPSHLFTLQNDNDPRLPQKDIKRTVRDIPFRHRYKSYGRWCIATKITWFLTLLADRDIDSDVPFVCLDTSHNIEFTA